MNGSPANLTPNPTPNHSPHPTPSPARLDAAPAGPVARRAAVHFLCIRRYVTVADHRPQGPLVRCPTCGKSAALPPRQEGDPAVRRFDIGC